MYADQSSVSNFLHGHSDEQADGKTQKQTVKQVDRNIPSFSLSISSSLENIISAEYMLVY